MSTATLDRPSFRASVPSVHGPVAQGLVAPRRPVTVRSAARPLRPVPPAVPVSRGVRLTRRGRLTLTLFIAVLALTLTVIGAASVSASSVPAAAPATSTVVVQPGQTLWEVAEQVAPQQDPREVIKRISDLNALPSAIVAPGQSLVIPAF